MGHGKQKSKTISYNITAVADTMKCHFYSSLFIMFFRSTTRYYNALKGTCTSTTNVQWHTT